MNHSREKACSILSYIGFLFLVGLVLGKDNPRVRFHVNQGLVLFIVEAAGGIVLSVLRIVLAFVPFVGGLLLGLLSFAFSAAVIVLVVIGILNAASGQEKPLPVIGGIKLL